MKRPVLLLLAALAAAVQAAAPRPNIVFVLVDDMGWGDLGVFYQNGRTSTQKFATPGLDAFALQGLQMRRHYCPAPVCAPSRASLLLGVHQGHSNIRNNQFDQTLDANHTLGTVMKGAGYTTACIGKWGLQGPGTPADQPSHPSKRGFDYFFGYLAHLSAHFHYPEQLSGNDNQGQPNGFFENTTDITDQLAKCYSTDLITARAKKWIADHRTANPDQPFFLYLSYAAPHARLDVPTQAYPAGGGISGGMQWTGTPGAIINTAGGTINSWIHPDYATQPGWTEAAKRYATMMRRIDDAMADLTATLGDLGIDGQTLVVFTSDHGPANEAGSGGSHTYDPRFFDSYGPMEGIKRDVLEGGIRVPTLVRWPGKIPAGGIDHTPSQFHDWLPTFAELAGVPLPARSDGVSLAPTLTGTGDQRPSTVYVEYLMSGNTPAYASFPNHGGEARGQMQAVFIDGYKGIRTGIGSHTADFRIYDTLADPAEATDLAGRAGVPPQQAFKDRVLRLRRSSASNSRPYDGTPVPPAAPPALVNGLEYRAYEKTTSWVPDWETETSASDGTVPAPDPTVRTRDQNVGLLFEGYIEIPTTGDYIFSLRTDTGAFVRLHDAQLIDADFGYAAGTEKSSGTIPLAAGHHPIRIHYRHADAPVHQLELLWSGPGIAKEPVPASAFFREGTPEPSPPKANPDEVSTTGGTPALIDVLANDSDDGTPQTLAISSVGTPEHGIAETEDDRIRYTPRAGFLGTDRFDYTITDGEETSTATVTVEVLPATATLWLPLDETEGGTARDALGRPVGTLVNFPENPWTAGRIGGALAFDGIDDRVNLHGRKGITGGAARTVTFWLDASAEQLAGTRPTIVSWGANNGTAAGTRFDINLNHTNGYKLRAEFNASGVNFTTASRGDLRGAGWVHCAIVVPENATVSQVTAYIDGEPATATFEPAGSGGVTIATSLLNDITLGRMADGTAARALNGRLDDVRIHDRALGAEEIAALASRSTGQNARDQWFFRHSGNDSPGDGDWSSDADGDGFEAWLEYALGGNPTAANHLIAPTLHAGDPWEFRFNRRREGIAADAYLPQISGTLAGGSWEPLTAFSIEPHPELDGFDLITVPLPPSAAPSRFVRLLVNR